MGAQAWLLSSNPQHLPARSWGPLPNQGLFLLSRVPQVKIWSYWKKVNKLFPCLSTQIIMFFFSLYYNELCHTMIARCFHYLPELVVTLRNSWFPPQCTKTPRTFATAANRWRVGHYLLPRFMGGGKDGRRKQELPVSLAESPLPFLSVWRLSHIIRNCCEDQAAPKATRDWPASYRLPHL